MGNGSTAATDRLSTAEKPEWPEGRRRGQGAGPPTADGIWL